jgi:hypothetical protein
MIQGSWASPSLTTFSSHDNQCFTNVLRAFRKFRKETHTSSLLPRDYATPQALRTSSRSTYRRYNQRPKDCTSEFKLRNFVRRENDGVFNEVASQSDMETIITSQRLHRAQDSCLLSKRTLSSAITAIRATKWITLSRIREQRLQKEVANSCTIKAQDARLASKQTQLSHKTRHNKLTHATRLGKTRVST